MGQVRIGRNLFIVILGAFIWLISAMIASAAENPGTTISIQGAEENRVCSCTCVEVAEEPESTTILEETNQANQVEDNQVNQVDNQVNQASIKLIMTEIYPAPLSGEVEYIKLFNAGTGVADISGWYLKDASDKKYTIKETILIVGESLVLDYTTTKISLNNSGDTVYLYDAAGNLRQSVEYPEVQKGTLLVYDGSSWYIENQANQVDNQANQVENQANQVDNQANQVNNQVNQEAAPIEAVQDIIEVSNEMEANQINQVSNQVNQVEEGDSLVYYSAQINTYKNWLDDSNLTVIGKIISPAGAWVANRCFVAAADQAIPVLCTKLAAEFVFDQVKGIQGEVVFKNGAFYRFDPAILNTSEETVILSGQPLSLPLEAYKLYEYQGIVKDFSEKYFKLELETENAGSVVLRWAKNNNWQAVSEGELIKGLAMADTDGKLWLWQIWEKMEIQNVDGEINDNNEELNNSENVPEASEPEMPAAYLGLGAAGILGGGKLAWTYREALKKIIPSKFKI